MKKNLLNVSSTLDHSISSKKLGFLCFIYTCLLQEFSLDFYSFIIINQIGSDLEELVIIKSKVVYINIRYPTGEKFISKNAKERYTICLDVIHKGLLRLAEQDKKMDVNKLEQIRDLIINKNFSFEFVYKSVVNKKNKDLEAKILIHPNENSFVFYVLIEDQQRQICKVLIYEGMPIDFYIDDLFFYGKWRGVNEFIVKGKCSEIEFHIYTDKCKIELINISTNKTEAPIFNLSRINAGSKELKDYISSLPPAIAAIITYEPN